MNKEKLSVVGIGKLGICFSLILEKCGYDVLGVDINQEYVDLINKKQYKTSEPQVEDYLKESKNFKATTSLKEAVKHSDILFILVATPTDKNGGYSHDQINSVIDKLEGLSKQGIACHSKHFIVCSTVMPGYCAEITDRLAKIGVTCSYNPEFIAQGTVIHNAHNPDMVLIGEANKEIGDKLEEIYKNICHNKPYIARISPMSAEITKIGLNTFLANKIAFCNMIGDLAIKSGCEKEVDKILFTIGSDSRIGNKFFKYGYGFSGPCIWRDSYAFGQFSKRKEIIARIPMAVDEANKEHLEFQFEQFKKNNSIKNEAVFDFVTFKPESTLLDNSQSLKLAEKLSIYGYKVRIKERKEVIDQLKKIYKDGFFIYEERV